MPKRLHDTGLWHKEWYRRLTPAEKAAWTYLLAECDNVGVLKVDFEQADFLIGEHIDWEGFPNKVNGNITVLENGKWWLTDFCAFQYGDLTQETKNPARLSHIALLKKQGLWDSYAASMPLCSGKGIAIDKDKDKAKEEDKDKKEYGASVRLTDAQYLKLCTIYGEPMAKKLVDTLSSAKLAKGYKYKSDYHAILSWVVEKCKAEPKVEHKATGWKCPHCGEANTHNDSRCMRCRKDRDDKEGAGSFSSTPKGKSIASSTTRQPSGPRRRRWNAWSGMGG